MWRLFLKKFLIKKFKKINYLSRWEKIKSTWIKAVKNKNPSLIMNLLTTKMIKDYTNFTPFLFTQETPIMDTILPILNPLRLKNGTYLMIIKFRKFKFKMF